MVRAKPTGTNQAQTAPGFRPAGEDLPMKRILSFRECLPEKKKGGAVWIGVPVDHETSCNFTAVPLLFE
jgi:hypothetical protein